MNRPVRFACGSALMFLAATQLAAQDRRQVPLPETLQPATRAAIERLADSLYLERLPGSALRDKAAEGVLKGADDQRILAAVRSLAQRLRDSRAALGADAPDSELLAAASAIFSGVSPEEISRFAAAQRKRDASTSLTVPLTVVAELASHKVPGAVALSSVEALLTRGARDVDFGTFRMSVQRDIRQGRTPADAVESGMRATLRGIDRTP